ncbi:MAG: hypothetical protein GF329_02870 [Candidatus Lokiarchaeota archaeon]|nr:hypothetical protein [Candidatus Lokiarchaeota archaeon]
MKKKIWVFKGFLKRDINKECPECINENGFWMMKNTYGDIPDFPTKKYFPMSRNLIKTLRSSGWEYLKMAMTETILNFYDIVKIRLDDAIQTAKNIMEEKIKNPEKTFSFSLAIPIIAIRTDLQQGTNVLLFGNSYDISFVVINDLNQEIAFILNTHNENGLPLSWYLVGHDDDILNRRHLKYGYKIRDIPKKSKNLRYCGKLLSDILKDIRNERSPQWSKSDYHTVLVYSGGVYNTGLEQSNYEVLSYLWEGINIDRYGWDNYFTFYPYPSFLRTLIRMERRSFLLRFCGLSSKHKLYLNQMKFPGICGNPGDWFKKTLPETIDKLWFKKMREGIPTPAQTLGLNIPNWDKKDVFKHEKFDYNYPKGKRITPERLGLSYEEVLRGVYLDIDHNTPLDKEINNDDIISTGMGQSTKIIPAE